MDTPAPVRIPRRQAAIGLGLMVVGLLLASCAPQSPPAPGSWAEDYARRKAKYREWGQGTGKR
jgi:ferric-dicitrate binding protein FerR (iron transport regulator)